jgi:hypothetical protein
VAATAIVVFTKVSAHEKVPVDAYVFDSLMPDLVGHDRRPSAFLLYLHLWRQTRGGTRPRVVSYRMLVDGTGLSKRSVQTALAWLVRRRLVRVKRKSPTDASTVTVHRDWRA